MTSKFALILLAGGSGLRMGAPLPKQFIEIHGKPILFYTVETFLNYNPNLHVFLALPKDHINYWHTITENWAFKDKVEIVEGGKERFFSVKNCLDRMFNYNCVAIHDAVRPIISPEFLERIFSFKKTDGGWVPVVPLVDSIRQKTEGGETVSVTRSNYCAVQTPQLFDFNKIKEAYLQPYSDHFTDDASVFESFGEKVSIFTGESSNRKITTQEDLIFANYYLKDRK